MSRNTPLTTLLAGAAIALGLLVASTIATAQDFQKQQAAPADATTGPAPAGPTASPPQTSPTTAPAKVNAVWAGRTGGGAATIAISVTDGVAVAYLCDGKRAEVWLQGTAANGKLTLSNPKGATLEGTFGGGKATGTVVATGRTFSFTAPAVTKPSGLYRATANVRGARVVGGWIVLADGSQVGVVSRNGEPAPAPPIDPASGTVTIDGTVVTVTAVNGPIG